MPKEKEWKEYFSPSEALRLLGLSENTLDAIDFGCGYGTFTIPAARIIRGRIYAIDIEPGMIETVGRKAKENNLNNVIPILRDFMSEGSGLEDISVDYAMLFNILHVDEPVKLLKEAHRILRFGGGLGIIHWNHDETTPAGPPMNIRPRSTQCRHWAESVGFDFEKEIDLRPYHFGIVMRK
ncbi:MAG TPA: class I SAM-dependent methyltransferase [Candidatus Bathyarchaeia archaeon]|nr:class I SAM-dependent methyltransferase [Candidatus Bathyarchaeia archaeon]